MTIFLPQHVVVVPRSVGRQSASVASARVGSVRQVGRVAAIVWLLPAEAGGGSGGTVRRGSPVAKTQEVVGFRERVFGFRGVAGSSRTGWEVGADGQPSSAAGGRFECVGKGDPCSCSNAMSRLQISC